jgi:hypothetical protein
MSVVDIAASQVAHKHTGQRWASIAYIASPPRHDEASGNVCSSEGFEMHASCMPRALWRRPLDSDLLYSILMGIW